MRRGEIYDFFLLFLCLVTYLVPLSLCNILLIFIIITSDKQTLFMHSVKRLEVGGKKKKQLRLHNQFACRWLKCDRMEFPLTHSVVAAFLYICERKAEQELNAIMRWDYKLAAKVGSKEWMDDEFQLNVN